MSGIVRAASGIPINVTSGLDRAMTGIVNQRPDQILDDPYGDKSAVNGYLNPAAFAQPALGTLEGTTRYIGELEPAAPAPTEPESPGEQALDQAALEAGMD